MHSAIAMTLIPIWLSLGVLNICALIDRRVRPLDWAAPTAGCACALAGLFIL